MKTAIQHLLPIFPSRAGVIVFLTATMLSSCLMVGPRYGGRAPQKKAKQGGVVPPGHYNNPGKGHHKQRGKHHD